MMVFALGVVFYEMLAGHRAFHGSTPIGTGTAILNDEPAPIASFSKLARFSDACGAEIPRWIRKKLESFGDDGCRHLDQPPAKGGRTSTTGRSCGTSRWCVRPRIG